MISVCIPTYNGARFIQEQLISILTQLSADDQVIISDDNSSDATLEIVRSLNDSRIEVYSHVAEDNPYKGIFKVMYAVNRNMNNALKYAKGDYIFFADQDDVWLQNKVQKIISVLNSGADCVVHDCKIVDSDLTLLADSFFNYLSPHNGIWKTLIRSSFMGCCMAFNRRVLERAYPIPSMAIEHDTWVGLCALKIGTVKIIKDKLLLYRRHGKNVSFCSEGSQNSLYVKLKRRLAMLYCFVFR